MNKIDRKKETSELCLKIGKKIRAIRKAKELTVLDVSYKSGVEPQNYRKYELGKQEMRISMFVRIAKSLDTEPSELLNFDK
jgi:transcriptional regulator with XRE-family HTH domain